MSTLKKSFIVKALFVAFFMACNSNKLEEHQDQNKGPEKTFSSNIDSLIGAHRLSVKKYDQENRADHAAFTDLVKKTNKEIDQAHPGQGIMIGASDLPNSVTFALFLDKELIGTAWYLGDGLGSIVIDPRLRSKGFGKYLFIESMAGMMQKYTKLSLRNDAKELGDYLYGTFATNFFATQLSDKNLYVYRLYNKDFYKQKIEGSTTEKWWVAIYDKLFHLLNK